MAERGARLARRDERAYREYVSEEQRSQTGCPARQVGDFFRTRDTNFIAGDCIAVSYQLSAVS
jgi:hypothetical protein